MRGALLTVLTTASLCAPLITFTPVLIHAVFQGDVSQFSSAMGAIGLLAGLNAWSWALHVLLVLAGLALGSLVTGLSVHAFGVQGALIVNGGWRWPCSCGSGGGG